jgi:hypothetical protein
MIEISSFSLSLEKFASARQTSRRRLPRAGWLEPSRVAHSFGLPANELNLMLLLSSSLLLL